MPYKDPERNKACISKWKKEHPEVALARRRRHRKMLNRIKLEIGCEHCKYNKHPTALQFHHINPSEKSLELSQTNNGLLNLLRETEKCMVLCANCHAIEEFRLNKYVLY